jgi:transposase
MNLRNSLDSVREGRIKHDRLLLPLRVSSFHENQLGRGNVKAAQIFRDRIGKWWVTFAVRLNEPEVPETTLPPAVLGIDLGIDKAVCTTLVTPKKVRESRFFKQEEKATLLRKYDNQVASLQRAMHTRQNNWKRYDYLSRKLKSIRTRRENLAKEFDRVLVRQLLDYIDSLAGRYTLYVAIGKLSNIRKVARRGNWRGPKFRKLIHSWAFSRVSESLRHQLAQAGWCTEGKDARFQAVPETWTSITCWKCGKKGTRPRQNLFVCPTCGNKCNADKNGAINIAGRLITLTKSLHSVRGLGKWASAIARSKPPKARGGKPRGKSLLPPKNESHSGESAAVHTVQMDLLSFGDKTGLGDDDQTVEKTVEMLSVVEGDISTSVQEKEARSEGGIPSQ